MKNKNAYQDKDQKESTQRPTGRRYWTTDDETRFIRRIGTGHWTKSHACLTAGRQTMLYRYREACLSRAYWGDIDKGRVLEFLEKQLMVFDR